MFPEGVWSVESYHQLWLQKWVWLQNYRWLIGEIYPVDQFQYLVPDFQFPAIGVCVCVRVHVCARVCVCVVCACCVCVCVCTRVHIRNVREMGKIQKLCQNET